MKARSTQGNTTCTQARGKHKPTTEIKNYEGSPSYCMKIAVCHTGQSAPKQYEQSTASQSRKGKTSKTLSRNCTSENLKVFCTVWTIPPQISESESPFSGTIQHGWSRWLTARRSCRHLMLQCYTVGSRSHLMLEYGQCSSKLQGPPRPGSAGGGQEAHSDGGDALVLGPREKLHSHVGRDALHRVADASVWGVHCQLRAVFKYWRRGHQCHRSRSRSWSRTWR